MAAKGLGNRQLLPVMAAGACVICLMLLIGNLGNLDLGGRSAGSMGLIMETEGMLLPLLAVLWVVVLLLVLLTARKRVPGTKRTHGGGGSGILIGLLLVASIVFVGAALTEGAHQPQGVGPAEDGTISQGSSQDTGEVQSPTTTLFPFLALVLALAVVVAAVLIMRSGMRPMPSPAQAPGPPDAGGTLQTTMVAEAIAELESCQEPRAAILAAYRRMSARVGSGKADDALTPREFALKTGWRLRESAPSLQALTALFEEARYSDHEMGEEQRERALTALRDIEDELGRKAG
jgi:hypothetical protein